jgi:hypothetical protein
MTIIYGSTDLNETHVKRTIFWYMTPCSWMEVRRNVLPSSSALLAEYFLLVFAWLTLSALKVRTVQPSEMSVNFTKKHCFTFRSHRCEKPQIQRKSCAEDS